MVKKTQLLCISSSVNSEISTYIKFGNDKIESSDELKVLGFIFGKKPTVQKHVDYILKKARSRLWAIRNIKSAGISNNDCLTIYKNVVRPCLEYVVPTYHPMLNVQMSDEIETVQKRACRIIFGYDKCYDEIIEEKILPSLQERREALTLNFARKCAASSRFGNWFPLKEQYKNKEDTQRRTGWLRGER